MLKAAEFDTWLCMLCTIRASRDEQRSLQAYGFCFVDVPSSWEERGPLAANLSSPFLVLALPLVSCAVSALGALARNSSRPRPFQRRLLSSDFAGRAQRFICKWFLNLFASKFLVALKEKRLG